MQFAVSAHIRYKGELAYFCLTVEYADDVVVNR